MFVKQFLTGGDRNFGYLCGEEESKESFIVDPSYSPKMIYTFAIENGYKIKYIFNTHNHLDHTNGNREIETLTGIPSLGLDGLEKSTGKIVADGTEFPLGKETIRIIHTPGHSLDSICIFVGDTVFTGDTLFVGKVGGTYFDSDAEIEYKSLHEKLLILPESTRVFPGHNFGIDPQSTILREKSTNPFLLRPDVESFIDLKNNWLEYKRIHGIE